ncbi:unnamed protein product [Camellia sinensis]
MFPRHPPLPLLHRQPPNPTIRPTTNIPTTITTFENPKRNFKTQVKTLGVVARLKGLDSLADPMKVFRRKEDQKEKSGMDVSSQRDGKLYEHQSNRKDSMAQQECKDEYEVWETSKVERSSYPAKRTINSPLSRAEMAFIKQKFMADHDWDFWASLGMLDNENLEHLAMMESLEITPPTAQNSKFKCFSGILRCLLCIGSLPTQPSDPTTDIPTTTTTTFENPKKNFKTQVKTPGVMARLMGLDSLPNPRKVFWRKEDQKEKNGVSILFIDNIKGSWKPIDNGLHQYHRKRMENHMNTDQIGKTQWRRKNVRMSKKFWKHQRRTFGQVLECLDNENLEHLAMMERLLGPLPQHMIISADLCAEKYLERSVRLDWLDGASSKESTRTVWKLPRQQEGTFGQVLELQKIFQEECTLGLTRGCKLQRKYEGSLEITPPTDNSKFKCFSGILRCPLYIGNLPAQPSDPTTDIPTTTTTFENQKKNFKTQDKIPGVVARLMGLDSLANPRKY